MSYVSDGELQSFSAEQRSEIGNILERAENRMMEKLICSIPDMLVHLATRQDMMKKLYEKLLAAIPEAKEDKATLAAVIQGLELKNPGMSPNELFELVPAEYRRVKSFGEKSVEKPTIGNIQETLNGIL